MDFTYFHAIVRKSRKSTISCRFRISEWRSPPEPLKYHRFPIGFAVGGAEGPMFMRIHEVMRIHTTPLESQIRGISAAFTHFSRNGCPSAPGGAKAYYSKLLEAFLEPPPPQKRGKSRKVQKSTIFAIPSNFRAMYRNSRFFAKMSPWRRDAPPKPPLNDR